MFNRIVSPKFYNDKQLLMLLVEQGIICNRHFEHNLAMNAYHLFISNPYNDIMFCYVSTRYKFSAH